MAAVTDIVIGITATSILTGTESSSRPIHLQAKESNSGPITLTFASGDTYDLDPGEWVQVIPGMVVTGTSASGAEVLQVLRGVVPDEGASAPPPSYDAGSGTDVISNATPEWAHVLTQQESASGLGNGTYEYYIDWETFHELTLQWTRSSGSGTDTLKVYMSAENDDTEADSCTYIDITAVVFSAASFTASFGEMASQTFRAKYVKVEIVRTGDTGTDGAWTLDIMGG